MLNAVKGPKCAWIFVAIILSFSVSPLDASTPQKINLMFYNTLNLFDNNKDTGKTDWTFLPLGFPGKKEACEKMGGGFYKKQCLETDWTDAHVKLKVLQLRKAISANQKQFVPDILGLCEVENANIVRALAQSMGYDPRAVITTESPDSRGIDVALVYKPSAHLRYVSHKEYPVPLAGSLKKPTRNILEVEFLVGGKHQLFVYVNHWPSQAAPAKARVLPGKMVRKLVDYRIDQNSKTHVIVMGDFNTIPEDRPHPFNNALLHASSPEKKLFDVHSTFMRHPKIPTEIKDSLPPGTYFYSAKNIWNQFDRFFVSPTLFDAQGLDFSVATYRIHNPTFLTRPADGRNWSRNPALRVPFRSDTVTLDPEKAGYSDHFAIKGSLIVN